MFPRERCSPNPTSSPIRLSGLLPFQPSTYALAAEKGIGGLGLRRLGS